VDRNGIEISGSAVSGSFAVSRSIGQVSNAWGPQMRQCSLYVSGRCCMLAYDQYRSNNTERAGARLLWSLSTPR